MSSTSTPAPPPPTAGAAFNMREMRESLALAEQLAKASMAGKARSIPGGQLQVQPIDANNNNEEPRTPAYVPPKQLLLYLVR